MTPSTRSIVYPLPPVGNLVWLLPWILSTNDQHDRWSFVGIILLLEIISQIQKNPSKQNQQRHKDTEMVTLDETATRAVPRRDQHGESTIMAAVLLTTAFFHPLLQPMGEYIRQNHDFLVVGCTCYGVILLYRPEKNFWGVMVGGLAMGYLLSKEDDNLRTRNQQILQDATFIILMQSIGMWTTLSFVGALIFPTLRSVFTHGEWTILTYITTLFLLGYRCMQDITTPIYVQVSWYGVLGVSTACILGTLWQLRSPTKILTIVIFPAILIETHVHFHPSLPFPQCIFWIFDFLCQHEASVWNIPVPRGYWVAYWVFIIVFAIAAAPQCHPHNHSPTIITRKWFHLIAVVLFWPVTMAAPQLMTLGYSVALALLLAAENIRHDIPTLHDFYARFLDRRKDDPRKPLVSHITLIAGCALPFFASNLLPDSSDDNREKCQLWGVITIGVGDAVAAIVGKTLGRSQWGNGGRTVEGSLAFAVSIIAACLWTEGLQNTLIWMPSILMVTVLEAFTVQLDNLVLPLAGTLVIVSKQKIRAQLEVLLMSAQENTQ